MAEYSFIVPGDPVPMGRFRFRIIQGKGRKPFAQTFTRKEDKAYQAKVAACALAAGVKMHEGAWEFEMEFIIERRKYMNEKGWPTGRLPANKRGTGDLDNLAKNISDALEKVAYKNDSEIIRLTLDKVHAACGEEPHTAITMRTINHDAEIIPRPPRTVQGSLFG